MLSVLFSSDQVDGICAAACVLRGFRIKGMACRFAGTLSQDRKDEDLAELADQINTAVFVIDYPPENIPDLETFLKKLSTRVVITYWSFTQPQKPETLALLAQYVKHIDYGELRPGSSFPVNKVCATELAAFRFLPGDSVGKQLSTLAADIKFWLRQDVRATKLADLLSSGYDPRQIADALSKGVVWDAVFERERNEYLEKKTRALEELLKRLTIKDYLNVRFGFSLSSPLLSTADACQHILDRHAGVAVAVALYKSGKIAFRSREGTDVDLAKLAKVFGGGGRKYASGGIFDAPISVEHWENVLAILDRKLKDYFLG
jgi:oligoribonuclease NrnB/cAMP/cGMP phosphodiesterase (DHH superfamily)